MATLSMRFETKARKLTHCRQAIRVRTRISNRQVMRLDLIRRVNLPESDKDVRENTGVFQVYGLNRSSECFGQELAVLL